ncbi:MAG TPA: M23 family metallopeptidase [bacterium]|nr:M23 family metallopeptidase [bacterium]
MKTNILIILIILLLTVGTAVWARINQTSRDSTQPNHPKENLEDESPQPTPPIRGIPERVTKKTYGTYVTPENSPVTPERFTGFHTGIDVEYGDVAGDVPIYAIAPGEVIVSRWAQGYGGVIVINHDIGNQKILALYGHLKMNSIPRVGQRAATNDQVGILGDAYSTDTDNERKHLHFGIIRGDQINLLGYVQNQEELSGWEDPIVWLKENSP